jgi:hypothetical protein
MKFPSLVLLVTCATSPATAFVHPHPSATTTLNLRRDDRPLPVIPFPHRRRRKTTTTTGGTATRLNYKGESNDGDSIDYSFRDNDDSSSSSNANVWSVLANTERWISDTLDRSNQAELTRQQQQISKKDNGKLHFADEKAEAKQQNQQGGRGKDNPYARKEVSYVCETGSELASVVGGVFRRVREARELGESHGRGVEAGLGTTDASQPATMRQTNVVVIPNCDELSTFQTFDKLVQAINQARRAARDFILKKKDDDDDGKGWV